MTGATFTWKYGSAETDPLKLSRTRVRSDVCRSNDSTSGWEDNAIRKKGNRRMYRTLSTKDFLGAMVLLATGLLYLL